MLHTKVKKRNNNFQGPNTYVQTSQQQGKLGKYTCMIASLMGEKKQTRFAVEYIVCIYYGNMGCEVSEEGISN